MSFSRVLNFACASALFGATFLHAGPAADLRKAFQNPPDDSRIMMRWWWFGPGVTKAEIEKEMRMMKAGGIGGFEVQPVYPLALDDSETGFKNLPYLSDAFLDVVRFTSDKARELGMRMDMTLCSGWPYGGPHVTMAQASASLRVERVAIRPGETTFALPNMIESEKLLAAFLVKARNATPQPGAPEPRGRRVSQSYEDPRAFAINRSNIDGRVILPKDPGGANTVLLFISSFTGQQVKRPSVGSEGFVLDHYSKAAIENHLKVVGDRLMQAFGSHPPYAVFSDSLEVYGADWTSGFLQEFQKRRGYDLTPHLPALAGDIGETTLAIRHDWARTLTELVEENYLTPINDWAKRHNTRFRSQTYGLPPVELSSNSLVALPEGEGPQWRAFSSTRWASSASHLYDRPVTSSETWTWLHSPVFRATPLDMKAEADLHFLQGINQLVGHGWPYSPDSAGEPGWRFYAAAVFNQHNPWWLAMPDITKYLQRVSFALRQGKPANDVAIYLPTDDTWAHMTLGQATINNYLSRTMNPRLIPAILDAGFNFDFIDDRAILSNGIRGGLPFKALILPEVERIPLDTYRKIEAFAKSGGIVIALGHAPSIAPGFHDGAGVTAQIQQLSAALFASGGAPGHLVKEDSGLGKILTSLLQPDFAAASNASDIGIVHRKLTSGDLYFVVNTSNAAIHTQATFRVNGPEPQWWDAMSGQTYHAQSTKTPKGASVRLDLEPYESRILAFGDEPAAGAPALPPARPAGELIDLTSDWTATLAGHQEAIRFDKLHSWADDPATRFYSGEMTYRKTVDVPTAFIQGKQVWIDFGPGTPVPDPHRTGPGMRALMESPVREAGLVYINGQKAGSVWHPPYRLDVTRLLHAGRNEIRIEAGNLALNELAGQTPPNYRLLTARYGERFQAQDMDQVQPLPSGLTGPVKLVSQ